MKIENLVEKLIRQISEAEKLDEDERTEVFEQIEKEVADVIPQLLESGYSIFDIQQQLNKITAFMQYSDEISEDELDYLNINDSIAMLTCACADPKLMEQLASGTINESEFMDKLFYGPTFVFEQIEYLNLIFSDYDIDADDPLEFLFGGDAILNQHQKPFIPQSLAQVDKHFIIDEPATFMSNKEVRLVDQSIAAFKVQDYWNFERFCKFLEMSELEINEMIPIQNQLADDLTDQWDSIQSFFHLAAMNNLCIVKFFSSCHEEDLDNDSPNPFRA